MHKQVDRLLSNPNINVDDILARWVPYIVGARSCIVYGDIGTSPLYAFKASLHLFNGLPITDAEILGVLSLIFWSLIIIVTVKYVMLVMRADNRGEGGILALMVLAQRVSVGSRMHAVLGVIGITGACLFFGDGVITPASPCCRQSERLRCHQEERIVQCFWVTDY